MNKRESNFLLIIFNFVSGRNGYYYSQQDPIPLLCVLQSNWKKKELVKNKKFTNILTTRDYELKDRFFSFFSLEFSRFFCSPLPSQKCRCARWTTYSTDAVVYRAQKQENIYWDVVCIFSLFVRAVFFVLLYRSDQEIWCISSILCPLLITWHYWSATSTASPSASSIEFNFKLNVAKCTEWIVTMYNATSSKWSPKILIIYAIFIDLGLLSFILIMTLLEFIQNNLHLIYLTIVSQF